MWCQAWWARPWHTCVGGFSHQRARAARATWGETTAGPRQFLHALFSLAQRRGESRTQARGAAPLLARLGGPESCLNGTVGAQRFHLDGVPPTEVPPRIVCLKSRACSQTLQKRSLSTPALRELKSHRRPPGPGAPCFCFCFCSGTSVLTQGRNPTRKESHKMGPTPLPDEVFGVPRP